MKVLALDQSSNKTGYSIFTDKQLQLHGVIDVTDNGEPVERISYLKKEIHNLINIHKPDVVVLEDIQQQNSPTVFKLLAAVLGVIENSLYEKDLNYFIIPSNTWKSFCNIKGRKRVEQKKNAQIFVENIFGVDVTEDEADSICLNWYVSNKAVHKSK